MPVAATDPPRPSARTTAEPLPASDAVDAPGDEAATDRLRALLIGAEPWSDRVRGQLSSTMARLSGARAVAVVGLAIALGGAAYVAMTATGATPLDPVQVLPLADAAAGAPSSPTSVGPDRGGASTPPRPTTSVPGAGGPPGSSPPGIFVHAAGAVAAPGVHRVASDARVADLIVAAGGLAADADPDRINLAAPVRDGERVYVPRRGEPAVPEVVAGQPDGPDDGGSGAPTTTAAPVDLNRADADELDALPGVGPATAAAIITHRTEHGPFASVDELQEVAGIGPAKLARLRDLVRV